MNEDPFGYSAFLPITQIKPVIYISGPISDVPFETAMAEFEKAENMLRSFGFEVVNPMSMPHDHDKSWQSYMKRDIAALCSCDSIFLLKNWYDSKGAVLEEHIASELSMKKLSWSSKPSSLHAYVKEFSEQTTIRKQQTIYSQI